MNNKPTYSDLENRIKQLETELGDGFQKKIVRRWLSI